MSESASDEKGAPTDFGVQSVDDSCSEPGKSHRLPVGAAQVLENESWSAVPKLFSSLSQEQRPLLMEIACEKESALTQSIQRATGKESSAVCCALWNKQDLGNTEGLQLVLEQIEALRPSVVWLSPPGSPYSPLQRTNQRSEAQKQELQANRQEALKTYVGCSVIWHYCVQHGIHVAWELAEKSDAWRLPLIQKLMQRYEPYTATTKGCRVNLRDGTGRLVQKGWKIMTTHKRLSELLHKPCRCRAGYEHGKCVGKMSVGSPLYPKEYQRLVVAGVQQELSMYGVQRECHGESQTLDLFGCGAACVCDMTRQSGHVQSCASCLLSEEDRQRETEEKAKPGSNQEEIETAARAGQEQGKDRYEDMEEFLKGLVLKLPRKGRGMMGGTQARPPYYQFGAYRHGPFSGISRRTQAHEQLCKYINSFLATWTSFVISYNNPVPWHRDLHNEKESRNHTCAFGSFTGGELEIQKSAEGSSEKVGTHHRVVSFSPNAWHTVCPWTGERISLSAYTVRGHHELSDADCKSLKQCGFPLPRRTRNAPRVNKQEACAGEETIGSAKHRKEKINKQLYLLHAATGHGSTRHLIDALRKRGASEEVLQAAKEFKCSICHERQRVQPRHLASLEPLPPKWHTVSADVGHWHHPTTGEDVQFLVVLDENTRFRTARILTRGSKQQPSATNCLSYFQEGWVQYFGLPRTLRLDPAGAFRSQALEAFCDKHSIFLDVAPAEAHWKIGSIEQAVQGIKEVLDKIHGDDPQITPEEALANAVRAFNHREQVRGFTPAQLALGRNADDTDRLVADPHRLPPDLLVENAAGEFQRDVQRRAAADKAHCEWHANQRLLRAQHSRPRRVYDYTPGELVFFWRSQESNKSRRAPGGKHGRFQGPARILATETRRDELGHLRPGSSVWCIRGKQLIKCCPEQLRRASEREALLEELSSEAKVPWTFTKVAEELGGNQFQDFSKEAPDDMEWERAQDPGQEVPPTLRRVRGKRPEPPQPTDEVEEEDQPQVQRPRHQENRQAALFAERWQDRVSESAWSARPVEYWMPEDTAVEVEIEVPDSLQGRKGMCQNLSGYFVGAMKRKAVEVSERKLTPSEREQFKQAKMIEVKNFIAAEAFKSLPAHLQPSADQAVGMRWILTWKTKDDGSRKAKARAVLLGYQDPSYEHRATTSPVMTRQSRQMFLQYAAWKKWLIQKGDVSGAFLQGREYPDTMYCVPCPEILEAMNLAPGTVTQLKKACYGLVDAPLEWYKSVDTYLKSQGFVRSWSDPCVWYWRVDGVLRGAICGHVDDFLFMGDASDTEWNQILESINKKFKWGDWERDVFTQCGVRIKATAEGYELSQPGYAKEIKEIPLSATRRREDSASITEWERTQLRMLLGGLSWTAQQVAPHLSAEVSLLLSETSEGTVHTIKKANQLLYQAQLRHEHTMKVHAFPKEMDLAIYAWVDAANQNRVKGGSTQGILVGVAPVSLAKGEVTDVSPISWQSSKIDRSCRSPGAAEVQAATNGDDALYYARYQWSEMLYGNVNVREPEETVKKTPGYLITDSRNVYDKLITEVLVIKGAEKRANIELLSIKDSQHTTGLEVRRVHSEAQLANGLTKAGTSREFELYYKMGGRWRIVEDPTMMFARRRKQQGLEPLQKETERDRCFSEDSDHVWGPGAMQVLAEV